MKTEPQAGRERLVPQVYLFRWFSAWRLNLAEELDDLGAHCVFPRRQGESESESESLPGPSITVERLLVLLAERDAVIVELAAQVAALQARLGQNPRNSSRPPSSEGCAKLAPQSQRRAPGRRPGGQDGGPGTTLRQVSAPHLVRKHVPAPCSGCGSALRSAPVVSTEARQVFDLPPITLQVTEHRLQPRRCGCGTVTMARPMGYRPG